MIDIYTSYYANIKNLPDNVCPISIAGKAPKGYNGIEYKVLAPKWSFFKIWKETHDNEYYIKNFKELVLDQLNPQVVYTVLMRAANGKIPCLICYEKPGDFCHRHLVADWLSEKLNLKIEEYVN